MVKSVGPKIMALAYYSAVFGIIASISALIILASAANHNESLGAGTYLLFLIVIPFAIVVMCMMLYAFGEMVTNCAIIAKNSGNGIMTKNDASPVHKEGATDEASPETTPAPQSANALNEEQPVSIEVPVEKPVELTAEEKEEKQNNVITAVIVGVLVVALIVFLIVNNQS